jgi:hypothetical protein
VDVVDALSRFSIAVEQHPVPAIRNASVARDDRRAADHLANQVCIFRRQVVERRNVPPRDDEDMYGRLGVDVVDRDQAVVLVHD